MAAKKRTQTPAGRAFDTLTGLGVNLSLRATKGAAKRVRASFRIPASADEVLERLSSLYKIPASQLAGAVSEQFLNLTNRGEIVDTLQELANRLSIEGAVRRTHEMTKGTLQSINELAERIGVPRDSILGSFFAILASDVESLTREQRQKVQQALAVIEGLRARAEEAEQVLVDTLGARHPISWPKLTEGINAVHEELSGELHALQKDARPKKAKAKPKAKPKSKGKAKSKAKAKVATARKSSLKSKTKAKTKPKAKAKSKTRA